MEKFSFKKAENEALKMQKKVESGKAKDYNEAEKQIDQKKEKKIESVLIPVEEMIPGIKPASEIVIGENERSGRRLDQEFSDDFFSKYNFNGYFLKPENSEKLKVLLEEAGKCENNEQLMSIMGKKGRDYYMAFDTASFKDSTGFALSQFKDQIVVDLGCGYHANGYTRFSLAEAKGYVGVDMYYGNSFTEGEGFSSKRKKELLKGMGEKYQIPDARAIPASFSGGDMLTFLKRLPDNSVSILASGIDENVLGNNEYIEKISKEIQRASNENGAFVSYGSCFRPNELSNEYEKISSSSGMKIYKKPKGKK